MSKNMPSFFPLLEEADNFTLRRAVERLREGLFDPFGVSLLTARESQLNTMFDQGTQLWPRTRALISASAVPMARGNPTA